MTCAVFSNVHLACKQITSAYENQNTLIFGADAAQRLAKQFSFVGVNWKTEKVAEYLQARLLKKLAVVYYAIKPVLDTHEPFKTRLNLSGSGYLSQVSFSDEDMPWHNTDNQETKSKQKGSREGAVDDLEAAETQFRIPGKIMEITPVLDEWAAAVGFLVFEFDELLSFLEMERETAEGRQKRLDAMLEV